MVPFPFAGELAALSAAFVYALGAGVVTIAAKHFGAAAINRARLLIAIFFLFGIHLLLYGEVIPTNADPERWAWLAVSGIIGLSLGDAALFQALVQIGASLTVLVFSTSPIFGALLAWIFLGEELTFIQILGMLVSLVGVAWVVTAPQQSSSEPNNRRLYFTGIGFALLGAVGQAVGAVTSKFGLAGDYPALSAQVIRMLAAVAAIWLFAILRGNAAATFAGWRERKRESVYVVIGALLGPVIGVWLSLIAFQYSQIGIASTLIAMIPIFILPINYLLFRERVTARALIGTFVAIAGIAILFLV
jgi:drug/metabolite transporter (DMT)-like permease